MSASFNCKCPERSKPIDERNWVVYQYKWNSGAFVAGNGEPSDYSTVCCLSCNGIGRTKAKYVDQLRQVSWQERFGDGNGERA